MNKAWWLATLIGLLLIASPAWSQEEAGLPSGTEIDERAAEAEHESPYAVVFRWVNFLILFGGLGYLVREPALEFFESRRQAIQGGLESAEKAQADSTKQLAAIEDRIARLASEIERIRTEANASAESERQRVVRDAKIEADRVLEQSRQEIERMARGFQMEIRAHVADLVVAGAEKRLKSEITEADQKRIIVRFGKNLN
jgi:F-type H+-transporting ATPase subunit b